MENVLQLFDLEKKQVCLRQNELPKTGKFTRIPYPYAPKQFKKWGKNAWWLVLILTGFTALVATLVVLIAKKPISNAEATRN